MTAPMSRSEILSLPPTISLPDLGRALGVSEPVIREQARCGELEALGIKVVRLGAQYRVVTASLWSFLGLESYPARASSESQPHVAARRGRASESAVRSVGGDEAG